MSVDDSLPGAQWRQLARLVSARWRAFQALGATNPPDSVSEGPEEKELLADELPSDSTCPAIYRRRLHPRIGGPAHLTIYSDGSCFGGRRGGAAGWGWIALDFSSGKLRRVFERNGWVDAGPPCLDHLFRVGADETSNNAGELQAFIELAIWLLFELPNQFSSIRSVEWVYDSKWTADAATGLCKTKCHSDAVRLAQHLLCWLVSRFEFHGRWVKGHSLEFWNDQVDALAKDGARRRLRTHQGATRAVSILDVLQQLEGIPPRLVELPILAPARVSTCPAGHALRRWRPRRAGYVCNRCDKESVVGDIIYTCRRAASVCDFDVCIACGPAE